MASILAAKNAYLTYALGEKRGTAMSVFRTTLPANYLPCALRLQAMFLLTVACGHEMCSAENKIGNAKELQDNIDSVLPKPDEQRWLRIPWQPNLMRGRLESQCVGKPMLIWIMDRNVLGCT